MTEERVSADRPRVAVIGGGIFGVTAALVLAPFCEIDLFERSDALFQGATFANHGRQHFGFHYPRSPETARQCLDSRESFRHFYGAAERMDFSSYYCVAEEKSRVSPEEYVRFCETCGLQFRFESPPEGILAARKMALSLRVEEGVIDYESLRALALALLERQPAIQIHLGQKVWRGSVLEDGRKELLTVGPREIQRRSYDYVINATYGFYNTFCDWFGFEPRIFQYNLQELSIIEFPHGLRLGVTIMDGAFPSVIPMGGTPYHLLAHVNESQLRREISTSKTPLLGRVPSIESNWSGVLEASVEYLPILRKSRYVKSLFVDRVVDASARETDARLTEVTDHGSGCFSIFAAKIITCVSTAQKLAKMICAQQ